MNLELEINPLTIEDARRLLESGVHFGQSISKRSPKMDRFVYGVSANGLQIIDLDQTWTELQKAGHTLEKLSGENKNILFIGTNKKSVARVINEFAQAENLNYITSRWLGGTLTNPITRNRVNYLRELEGMETSGLISSMNAKEASFINKKLKKLRKHLGGLKNIKGAIHAIVIVDPQYESNATLEALKKKGALSIIAVSDTDCSFDPQLFDHFIPCNTGSVSSMRTVMSELVGYINRGKEVANMKKAVVAAKPTSTIKKPIVRNLTAENKAAATPKVKKEENN